MKKNEMKAKEVTDSAATTAQPAGDHAKLAIGEVNDPLEKEADVMADKIKNDVTI